MQRASSFGKLLKNGCGSYLETESDNLHFSKSMFSQSFTKKDITNAFTPKLL